MPVSKSPARKTAVRRAVKKTTAVDDYEFQPVSLTATAVEEDIEKFLLFSITQDDGSVDEYFIPKVAPVSLTLKVLRVLGNKGEMLAGAYLIEQILGEEGYEALINCEGLTGDALEQITQAAMSTVVGRPVGGKAR